MHRILALVLALALAIGCCTAALAEDTQMTIHEEKIPAGYSMTYSLTEEGGLQAVLASEDAASPIIYFAIGLLDQDFTFDQPLTEEELNAITKELGTDYADPQVKQQTAENGLCVVSVEEKDVPYYADFFTAWQGYSIQLGLLKEEPLTEEDLAQALQLISTLWTIAE